MRLSDGVVALTPLAVVDAADHLAGQDDVWRRWLGSGPRGVASMVTWLSWCEDRWQSDGPVFVFGIRDVGAGGLLGTVELHVDGPGEGQASIWCGLYPVARGRGIAARACRLASGFALCGLGVPPCSVTEVVAQIDPCNLPSLRMIERAGFAYASSCLSAGAAWEVFTLDRTHLDSLSAISRGVAMTGSECLHVAGAPGLHGPRARPLALSPLSPAFGAITTAVPASRAPRPESALGSKVKRMTPGLRWSFCAT